MRVLLLERQPAALKRALERKGFRVDVVDDGTQADAKARSTSYDLVVVDQDLLNGTGLSLVQRWRKDGLKTHILVVATHPGLQGKLDALSVGADDVVAKLYSLEELTARVAAVTRRGDEPKRQETLKIHDLEIDVVARNVRRRGQPIDLTPREFELLQFLASHRGQTVSRAMIWEHLYADQAESRSNVVDVYIRYLRKKIDKGFEPPLIVTCWGKGYRLGDELEAGN
jgi:DNA-binding response OmpR family regulator